MYLAPSSPPFFASSPSLANDDFEEQQRKDEADLMVMASIRGLEDEAARARQDVAQLKKRIAEMELSMATLNAKLHRALSKLAHMEADRAAAERASIEQGRSDMALALWAEGRRASSGRPPLGHLMRLGDTTGRRRRPAAARRWRDRRRGGRCRSGSPSCRWSSLSSATCSSRTRGGPRIRRACI
jgi:septal ring factor EnvC (AmiA/AmiB activator)